MHYKPPYTIPSQIINLISEISQNLGKLETLNLDKSFQSLRKKSKVKSTIRKRPCRRPSNRSSKKANKCYEWPVDEQQ